MRLLMIAAGLCLFANPAVAESQTSGPEVTGGPFPDVPVTLCLTWGAVENLRRRGIFVGYPPQRAKASSDPTGAKRLAKGAIAGNAQPAEGGPFVDVPLTHWAYDAVESLRRRGILRGYPAPTPAQKRPAPVKQPPTRR